MKPGFKFDVSKNANLKSVCAVKKLLKIVQGRTPIRHRIGVLILDTYVLDHSNKEAKALKAGKHAVFGLFVPKKSKKRFAQFWIPGCDCMIILPARLLLPAILANKRYKCAIGIGFLHDFTPDLPAF